MNPCNGGMPDRVFDYYKRKGAVTGGTHGSHEGCLPDRFPSCHDPHVSRTHKECAGPLQEPMVNMTAERAKCRLRQCGNRRYSGDWTTDRINTRRNFRLVATRYYSSSDLGQIMNEIHRSGPVQATMFGPLFY